MPLTFLLRRLFTSCIVIVGVVTLTFFAARILPGDPAQLYAGARARPDQLVAVRAKLGLDRPLPQQFIHYVGDLLRGDWGISFKTKRTVAEDLRIFLPATLEMVLLGFAAAMSLGILLGVLSSAWEGGLLDQAGSILASVGASMPVFWIALLGQQLFFNQLGWLPLNGRLDAQITMNYPLQSLTGFLLLDSAITGNWSVWWDALAHHFSCLSALAFGNPVCNRFRQRFYQHTSCTRADLVALVHTLTAQPGSCAAQPCVYRSGTVHRHHPPRHSFWPPVAQCADPCIGTSDC